MIKIYQIICKTYNKLYRENLKYTDFLIKEFKILSKFFYFLEKIKKIKNKCKNSLKNENYHFTLI